MRAISIQGVFEIDHPKRVFFCSTHMSAYSMEIFIANSMM